MKSILDRTFEYVPAAKTDLKKTFDRIRRMQKQLRDQTEKKVTPIGNKKEAK